MIIVLYVFVFLALLSIVIYIYGYTKLILERQSVYNKYFAMNGKLNNCYGVISEYLNIVKNIMNYEKSQIDSILKLQADILAIGNNLKEMDRKIALDTELDKRMQNIFFTAENYPVIKKDEKLCNLKELYLNNRLNIVRSANAYNSVSKKLIHSVSVFPTSFIARLNRIKSADTVYLR